MKNKILVLISALSALFAGSTCNDESKNNKLDKLYLINLQEERQDRNWRMQFDRVNSPFFIDSSISFKELSFFEPSANYIFTSKLYKYENPETVEIYGTQGDKREYLRYGYFLLSFDNKKFKLNLYKIEVPQSGEFYNLWFKDATNGIETYENGRYLFFTKNDDDNYEYAIDFNRAINPMCAYSKLYNCPIPTSQDSIPFEIKAGEKKF